LHSGANPLSKVRFTRHILWLALWVARSRAMQKCSRHFCPGTIFKEPASGGFLRLCGEPVIEGSIHSPHPCGSPFGPRWHAMQKCSRHFRVRAPSLKNPPLAGFCVYGANPSSKVRQTPAIPEHSEFRLSRAHSTSQPCSNTNRFHGETNCQVCLCAALPDWHRLISCPACN